MRLVIAVLLAASLAACGFKGPLYLPKPEPKPAKPAPEQASSKTGTPEPASK